MELHCFGFGLHRPRHVLDYSQTTVFIYTSIIGVTIWHLGSPYYILVSSLSLPYPCPVTFSLYYCRLCLFSSLHIVSHIVSHIVIYSYLLNICIVFCYNYPLAKYILQLILVFSCSFCTSLLPYIPT